MHAVWSTNMLGEVPMTTIKQTLSSLVLIGVLSCWHATAAPEIPVAAPMNTELAGATASVAVPSVFRIICVKTKSSGTGFLHKSGVIVTAQHVINDSGTNDIIVITAMGQVIHITNIVQDFTLDLAALMPSEKLSGACLQISTNATLKYGMQVSTWGFPEGYQGFAPLLTTGYISGMDAPDASKGNKTQRIVVNAAFNCGNSGGPLVEIENGTVIGVVCSKLAPLPAEIDVYLNGLKKNAGMGIQYMKQKTDGTTEPIMEGQVIEEILRYLRSQTQLVIGYACTRDNLVQFLKANGIQP